MRKKLMVGFAVMVILATFAVPVPSALADGKELVIADFDTGSKPNNIGGDFGSWDKDPDDDTQGTRMTFEPDDALGNPSGYAVRLDYDVDSPNPAYNGFWTKLNGEDLSNYNALTFYIKGDPAKGFTKRVKVELKDQGTKTSAYVFGNVTEEWQKVVIPFDKFRRITDWSKMGELVFVFDDMNSRPKTGTILIDQLAFAKE